MTPSTSPIRRATIFCRDIEPSLRCYRDILGLAVVEDKRLSGPEIGQMLGLADCTIRIVHLQSGESTDGLIGLYAIEQGRPPELPSVPPDTLHLGQVVLVFFTTDLERIIDGIRATGLPIVSEPKSYVKRDQTAAYTPVGTYREIIFLDPDGVAVNVVQHTADDPAD